MMSRGKSKGRHIAEVWISDWESLRPIWEHPGALELLAGAIEEAKRSKEGFGWSASAGLLVTADLDQFNRKLIRAELYVRQAEYRAPELREEKKSD
jgi:hypothetical protein